MEFFTGKEKRFYMVRFVAKGNYFQFIAANRYLFSYYSSLILSFPYMCLHEYGYFLPGKPTFRH